MSGQVTRRFDRLLLCRQPLKKSCYNQWVGVNARSLSYTVRPELQSCMHALCARCGWLTSVGLTGCLCSCCCRLSVLHCAVAQQWRQCLIRFASLEVKNEFVAQVKKHTPSQ